MSRIGGKPVAIPGGVTVDLNGQDLSVKGPKGQLAITLVDEVTAVMADGEISIKPRGNSKRVRSMWGMQRALVSNMVRGVGEGFKLELQIVGVGYRAAVQGKNLQLQLGYSHEVLFAIPDDVQVTCSSPTLISVSGIDRQRVGQVAALIRQYRVPEPYKGKGVRYVNEYIFRKEGKKK